MIERLALNTTGAYLKALREKRGYTAKELARVLIWPKSKLSKIENNKLGLSIKDLKKIAKVLKVDPAWLEIELFITRFPAVRHRLLEAILSIAEATRGQDKD